MLFSISRSLEKHLNGDFYYINPFNSLKNRILVKILTMFDFGLKKIFNKHYLYPYNAWFCKNLSRYVEKEIEGQDFDLIFAPGASSQLAFLNTKIPIVYLSDSTFNLLYSLDAKYADVFNISLREGNLAEGSTIKKADLILYPSKWAAESALKDYGADESKVHVVPFGANLEEVPPVELVVKRGRSESCNLLFLGVDWERKGVKQPLKHFSELEKLDINANLTLYGCLPPREFVHERMRVLPFMDRNDENDRNLMNSI